MDDFTVRAAKNFKAPFRTHWCLGDKIFALEIFMA